MLLSDVMIILDVSRMSLELHQWIVNSLKKIKEINKNKILMIL